MSATANDATAPMAPPRVHGLGREWLYRLINRLDPAITRGVQELWLQETQTWAVASTVFPVAATTSYEDLPTVDATRTTGD